ncbi:MAG: metal-dependent hydrolase [Erythrobacter sp.]
MDNLTHSLVGALLGQAGLKKKTGLAMPALIIGANLPDVDAACFFWLEGQEHLGFRRGITHGPPALVLLPLILAGLLWGFDRWQTKRGKRPEDRLPVNFKWLFALSFIGCLSHPALDWLNVYGIRFLEPFSSQWFYGDTLFIIDIWLWLLMGFATWFSLRREKSGGNWKRPARIALIVSLLYIGVNWVGTTYRELTAPRQPAIASPMPLIPWEREIIEAQLPGVWLIDGVKVGQCELAPAYAGAVGNSEAEAFLFWTRAPFAERAEDGSVILRDARFYDPSARDRFSIALPNVECVELPGQ